MGKNPEKLSGGYLKLWPIALLFILFTSCAQDSGGESELFKKKSDGQDEPNSDNDNDEANETNVTTLYLNVFSDKFDLPLGETATLTAIAYRSDGSIQNISTSDIWSTTQTDLVNVSLNEITALSSGIASIQSNLRGKDSRNFAETF